MSRKRPQYGITRDHGAALQEIIAWAMIDPATTPLELGVLEEMRARLLAHAKNGAIVRIRIKNQGSRHLVIGETRAVVAAEEWTDDEKRTLRACFVERMTLDETHERLPQRTTVAIQTMKRKLGLDGRWHDARHWSEEDMETLRTMAREGYCYEQIAPLVGRTPNAVADFASRMEIAVKRKVRQRRHGEPFDPITGERPQGTAPVGTRAGVLAIMRQRRMERGGQPTFDDAARARLVASRFAKERLATMAQDAAD